MDMDKKRAVQVSKLLSFVLRHKPEYLGITLDSEGWTDIGTLIEKAHFDGQGFTRLELDHVVATCDKQRYAISEDGLRVRANQGHSTQTVEMTYAVKLPPEYLYHGTAERFMDSIRKEGIKPAGRHHVHLSETFDTAKSVGARHGKPVVLIIDALTMAKNGFVFYLSDNNVWLVDQVPVGHFVSNHEIAERINAQANGTHTSA
ncbi:RNA 2'-phosphotransferase [Paraburkholderia sp. BCC1886]|uniref:RNA 2'-phosphotransferase n=1 Tax=Paraburkholderia sp. BCC1886 TaxID=2562670 RepID=UPI001C927AB8|nr:RNA 2'-phosphotransferase [Paraburkholderia sp. BCC1886]